MYPYIASYLQIAFKMYFHTHLDWTLNQSGAYQSNVAFKYNLKKLVPERAYLCMIA